MLCVLLPSKQYEHWCQIIANISFLSVFAWKPLTQDQCLECIRQAVSLDAEQHENLLLAHEKGKDYSCSMKIEDLVGYYF